MAYSSALRIGNENVPIQLAQCWFPGLTISNAKILIYFSNKIYGSSLSNSTQKLLWFEITKMPIAVFKKKNLVPFIIIFGSLSFPMGCELVFVCVTVSV